MRQVKQQLSNQLFFTDFPAISLNVENKTTPASVGNVVEGKSARVDYKASKPPKTTRGRLLSGDEQLQLVIKAKNGDKEAKYKLIECNEGLIQQLVLKYHTATNKNLEIQDLQQEARMAILDAIDRFEPKRKVKFSTFATIVIRTHLYNYLGSQVTQIAMSGKTYRTVVKVGKMFEEYTQYGYTENEAIDKIAEETKTSKANVFKTLQTYRSSKEDFEIDDQKTAVSEDFNRIERENAIEELEKVVYKLKPRERQMLTLRYGLFGNSGMEVEELAIMLDLSVSEVKRVLRSAFKRIRENHCEIADLFLKE